MNQPRANDVTLLVLGVIGDLKDRGLISGDGPSLTCRGVASYDQLRAAGERPTDEEIDVCLRAIKGSDIGDFQIDAISSLLKKFFRNELPEQA